MQSASTRSLLPGLITLLAVTDGCLHLALDFVLFRGNLFGALGPPPGAPPGGPPGGGPRPPELPLPLNELFVLNFVGYIALALLFWFAPRVFGARRWIADLLLGVYVAAVFAAWWSFGRPNPMGLGLVSKSIEVVLLALLLTDIWKLFARPQRVPQPA